jgi:sporadic carbohydrate cluster protein (TIGR04323 family)
MKKLKGYVFSRKFNGNLTPQKIQNIILRDYSLKKNYNFIMSSVEYSMNNCFFVLEGLVKSLKKYDGIVAYSIFQMPSDQKKRIKIYKEFIFKKKELHFALEDVVLSKNKMHNINFIEETISIRGAIDKTNFNIDNLKNYI